MTSGSTRAALTAVQSARPIVERLNSTRDKEDVAADIIDAWNTVETGLRSLVGGTALSGQQLIRELRQRQFLNLEQANALAQFHAARERASRTEYVPTDGDVAAVRDAFDKLETGLLSDNTAAATTGAPYSGATMPMAPVISPSGTMAGEIPATYQSSVARKPAWLIPAIVVALLMVGGGAWFLFGRGGGNASYAAGVTAYSEGRREAAEGSFRKAAADDPKDPMPHVYLARMERERGNLQNANAEAVAAVKLDENNGLALRELASTLFAQQNLDGARTFYIRAVKADTADRVSQGFLGCTLVRLGRVEEGNKWIQRAGTGAWTSCVTPAPVPTAPNPAVPMTVRR